MRLSVKENAPRVTAVFDKGRRGEPIRGCDCVQCFGYCLISGTADADLRPAAFGPAPSEPQEDEE